MTTSHRRPDLSGITSTFIPTNGITLHAMIAGPDDGPLVILLHGFPEFWYGWRWEIAPLADAGYRVIALDQRGYNLSDKPRRVRDYTIEKLVDDVVGVIDYFDRETATIVGHDWGGAVAWHLAARHASRVERLVAINLPHPRVLHRTLRTSPRQMVRSWYVLFFQLPWLPEALLRWNRFALLRRALRRTSRSGTFTDEDLDRYVEAWIRPGELTATIDWYRASFRAATSLYRADRITVPTRIVWGTRDAFLIKEMVAPSLALCDDGDAVMIDGATHWVQHEEWRRVVDVVGGGRWPVAGGR